MSAPEYGLVLVAAPGEDVDAAMGFLAPEWSSEALVGKADMGGGDAQFVAAQKWTSVVMSRRAVEGFGALVGELVRAPVVMLTVGRDRLSVSYAAPGKPGIGPVDGRDSSQVGALAQAFGKEPTEVAAVFAGDMPAVERHARLSSLLWLPLPPMITQRPAFDGVPSKQPSEMATIVARFGRRRTVRRIQVALGFLQLALLVGIYVFFDVTPSLWLFPTIGLAILNGMVLLWVKRHLPRRPD